MKKLSIALALIALSACMDGGGAAVSRASTSDVAGCPGIQHMNTVPGLELRCGPQSALPYTIR